MKIIKTQELFLLIITVLLFGASMNFQAKFFYFAFSLMVILCFFEKRIVFNNMTLVYGIVGILMGLYHISDGFLSVIRCFSPVVCYIVGYNVMLLKKEKIKSLRQIVYVQEKKTKLFMTSLALGSFSHLMLNWINNVGLNVGRNTIDIWSGSILSATGQASIGCLMVGFSSGLILCPINRIERLTGFIFTFLLLGYNLVLGGRTLIVMYIVVVGLGFIFMIFNEKRKSKIRKFVLWSAILVIIFIVCYYNNIGGIKDIILSSNLYERFFGTKQDIELLRSGRSERRVGHLKNMFKYPFGGKNSRIQYGYAHDLLLDAYDEYGVLVFGALIAILISALKNLYKVLKSRFYDMSSKIMLLTIYMAILIQFFLEPILEGMPWLFVCFCFLNGCVVRQNIIIKKVIIKEKY